MAISFTEFQPLSLLFFETDRSKKANFFAETTTLLFISVAIIGLFTATIIINYDIRTGIINFLIISTILVILNLLPFYIAKNHKLPDTHFDCNRIKNELDHKQKKNKLLFFKIVTVIFIAFTTFFSEWLFALLALLLATISFYSPRDMTPKKGE